MADTQKQNKNPELMAKRGPSLLEGGADFKRQLAEIRPKPTEDRADLRREVLRSQVERQEVDPNVMGSEMTCKFLDLLARGELSVDQARQIEDISRWGALKQELKPSARGLLEELGRMPPSVRGRLSFRNILRSAIDQFLRDRNLAQKPKGKESLWENLSDKTKRFYEQHTTLSRAVLLTAVAYGSYRIFKYFQGEKKEGEKSSKGRLLWGMGALAVAGIGIMAGKEGVFKWFKEQFGGVLKAKDAMEKANEVANLFSQGKILEAYAKWQETPDPQEELHQKAADHLKTLEVEVPKENLRLVGGMSYQSFMEQQGSWGGYLTHLNLFQGDELFKKVLAAKASLSEGSKNLFLAFAALEETLDANGKPILEKAEAKGKTVDEVLKILIQRDLSAARERLREKGGAKKRGGSSEPGFLERAAESTAEVYTGLFSDVGKESLEELPPRLKEVIQKFRKEAESPAWKEKGSLESIGSIGGFAWDVTKAVQEEGFGNLLVSKSGVFAWIGAKETGKWVLIGTNKAVVSAFWELATLDPLGAFEHYSAGATPFMIAGGGIGLLSKGPMGAARGVWRGFKLPWQVVSKEYEIITQISHYGKPDVLRRYASLGAFKAGSELRHKARWLSHWGAAARHERKLIYESDQMIALKEHLSLVKEQLYKMRMPGRSAKGLEAVERELEEKIEDLKIRLEYEGVRAEEILEERKLLRLRGIFGENAEEAIQMILKDEGLEKIFLEQGHRNVVRGLLETDRPEFFVKLLKGPQGKELLEVIERKDLLRNKNFLSLMREFDTLFGPAGEVDQGLLAQIVKRADDLDLPRFEKMLQQIQEWIRKPTQWAGKGLESGLEWVSRRKAIEGVIKTYEQYVKPRVSGAVARFNAWRGPKFEKTELELLLKERNPIKIRDFLASKGLKTNRNLATLVAEEGNSIDNIKYVLEEIAKESGKVVKFAPDIAPLSRMAKLLRVAKPVAGAGLSALAFLEPTMDAYHAATTENAEKKGLYIAKGIGGAVGASVEVLVMHGVGMGAGMATSAALLAPTYMWNTGFEAAIEGVTESKEWAAQYDHETLVHQWVSTGALNAGEAYYRTFTAADEESMAKEYRGTCQEVLKAILEKEGQRFDKENEYRMVYLEKMNGYQALGRDYQKALEALHESRLYAELMVAAESGKEAVGDLDLLQKQFKPYIGGKKEIEMLMAAYHEELKGAIHPQFKANFDQLSTGELVGFCWELDKAFSDPKNEGEWTENEESAFRQLKHYLFYVRGVEADQAIRQRYLAGIEQEMKSGGKEMPDNPEELAKARQGALEKLKSDYNLASLMERLEQLEGEGRPEPIAPIDDNAGCNALTKLAQFFGYDGLQNEKELREFFTKERGDAFGLYWHKDAWYANESWWKDLNLGPAVSEEMVVKLAAHFRANPGSVLEHRQEAAVYHIGNLYKTQVLKMADILENSLKEPKPQKKMQEGEGYAG